MGLLGRYGRHRRVLRPGVMPIQRGLREGSGINLEDAGISELKGLPGPQHVF